MPPASIQQRFAAQTARTPHRTAVTAGTSRLSYRQLDERANRLAHHLLRLGVRPEEPVAVLMERSPHLLVAILAVLKAGACYLPLHGTYPDERMGYVLDQADCSVLLADAVTRSRGTQVARHVIAADEEPAGCPPTDPRVPCHPLQLAYLMSTSGSTGRPKSVAVSHRDVLGLALDPCWDEGRHERVLMVAPYAFGVSTFELWVPLLRGGEAVLAPPGDLRIATLRGLLARHDVTAVHLTAGLFRVVAEEDPGCLAVVREVMTGGDVIPAAAVRRVLDTCPDLVVRAMYGSTESTLFATHFPMTAATGPRDSVPAGRPMAGMRAYVLDESLAPVGPGEVGELYIAGTGVARGYLGRPGRTAERFVPDPFHGTGERMYRTGDLARRTDDGLLHFAGRADDQVKIRGFRVEPQEVEAVLARHPRVVHTAVVAGHSGDGPDRRLTAYVVPDRRGLDPAELGAYAARSLPDFMVPSGYVMMDVLPLTPNGKVDRRALPAPEAASAAYRAPLDSRQEALCRLFTELLGVEHVGLDDDFFALGGNSLLAMQLINRIHTDLDAELSVPQLFEQSTVAALADHIGPHPDGVRPVAPGRDR